MEIIIFVVLNIYYNYTCINVNANNKNILLSLYIILFSNNFLPTRSLFLYFSLSILNYYIGLKCTLVLLFLSYIYSQIKLMCLYENQLS